MSEVRWDALAREVLRDTRVPVAARIAEFSGYVLGAAARGVSGVAEHLISYAAKRSRGGA